MANRDSSPLSHGAQMTRRRKLTQEQVQAMRAAYKPGKGAGYSALARQFGIAESTVRDAIQFYTYADVRSA